MRHTRRGVIRLGLAGILVITSHAAPLAQSPSAVPGRLTVRREMATGQRTANAGEQAVDSVKDYIVYVPPACVGERRCPLVVVVHGGGGSAREQLGRHRELAEKYEMIMLLGTSVLPGRWNVIDYFSRQQLKIDSTQRYLIREMPGDQDTRNVDAAMKYVLRHYAIDPAKIALLGMSDGGAYTLFIGRNNLDLFSRLASMSPGIPFQGAGPANTATQVFMLGGLSEGGFFQSSLIAGKELRQAGHQVKQAVLLRPHQQRRQDYDLMFSWLKESWTPTGAGSRPALRTVTADSVATLTPEVITQMTTFWTSFTKSGDSALRAARTTHRTEIVVPVGELQLSLPIYDIPALAAQYPSVAADLKTAGLTAKQEEAYAVAFLSALATKAAGRQAGTVPAGSMLAKNIEFVTANQTEVKPLERTGILAQ